MIHKINNGKLNSIASRKSNLIPNQRLLINVEKELGSKNIMKKIILKNTNIINDKNIVLREY
tara:strand:+ start:312 stop:497 length:186 start_codon:yes stop_codon:yes gene_type:complete